MPAREPSGCLPAILKLFGFSAPVEPSPVALPYRRKDYLLTKAERSFFVALREAVGRDYLLFAKND